MHQNLFQPLGISNWWRHSRCQLITCVAGFSENLVAQGSLPWVFPSDRNIPSATPTVTLFLVSCGQHDSGAAYFYLWWASKGNSPGVSSILYGIEYLRALGSTRPTVAGPWCMWPLTQYILKVGDSANNFEFSAKNWLRTQKLSSFHCFQR